MAAVFWEHQAKTLKMVFSSAPQENFFGSNFFRGSTKKQKDFIVALDIWAAGRGTDTVCVTSHYLAHCVGHTF